MHNLSFNMTSLAIILWSGMLIIAGSIWVLCSQIGKLTDIIEANGRQSAPASAEPVARSARPTRVARAARRSASAPSRRSLRVVSADSRQGAA